MSWSISVAEEYRSLGSNAMPLRMICSSPTGILGFRLEGLGAPPLMCWMATATGDSPSKGGRPVIISYITTLRE